MGKRNWISQQHPAVSAAFSRQMPERLTGEPTQRPRREPMSDEELKAWSDEQAKKFGIHTKAAEAAKRGRTLMVFLQAESRSVPYDEYKAHLDDDGLPIGTPKPLQMKLDRSGREEPAGNTANNGNRPSRRSTVTREAGRIQAGPMTEEELAAEFGHHGGELDDLLAEAGIAPARETGGYPHLNQGTGVTNPAELPQPGTEAA